MSHIPLRRGLSYLLRRGTAPCTSRLAFRNVLPCDLGRRYSQSVPGNEATPVEPPRKIGLERIITDSIKATGPLPLAHYMQLCLSHPTEGYYMKRDVFGAQGDFITSPEISQVFGELIAIWLLTQWMAKGQPARTRLIELGPGRATLMADVLRTLSRFKDCRNSLTSVHMVETSEALTKIQREKLGSLGSEVPETISKHWHQRLEDITPGAETDEHTMILAHEFFDALPIHLLEKTENGFREVLVDINRESLTPSTNPSSPQISTPFRLVVAPTLTPTASVLSASSPRFASLPAGSRLEVSPVSWSIAHDLPALINGLKGGSALLVDYGDDRAFGSSFRAFRNHNVVDPFEQPGQSDLTANVDFAYLKEAISSKAITLGPLTQREFLVGLGLEARVNALLRAAKSDERVEQIASAAKRLVDPLGMGTQYKVMGVIGSVPGEVGDETKENGYYPFQATSSTSS